MKARASSVCLAVLTLTPASAHLLAQVDTTEGRIRVELQYTKAPLAVANFITLAQGTRPHLDPATGTLSTQTYYLGESFFRVVNQTGFRIAQTGSGTGSNSGGPGYNFKDEFDPTLRHTPYVLSMANSGPNTNGSQIFFVGNSTPSHLNDVHTIFGLITDAASRAVIDAIHHVGDDGSSITGITFERTDPPAQAFDEHAQALPTVLPAPGSLSVTPAGPVRLTPSAPFTGGQRLSIFRSSTLASWSPLPAAFFGHGSPPATTVTLDQATGPRAFYHLARIHYPDSLTPDSLANRTLTLEVADNNGPIGPITLAFDPTGSGGTSSYNGITGTIEYLSHSPDGYSATLITGTTNLNPLLIKLAYDTEAVQQLSGRVSLSFWNGLQWAPVGSGSFTLSATFGTAD